MIVLLITTQSEQRKVPSQKRYGINSILSISLCSAIQVVIKRGKGTFFRRSRSLFLLEWYMMYWINLLILKDLEGSTEKLFPGSSQQNI